MLRFILSMFCFALSTISSFSQKEVNIWYFGKNRGLDFSGGAPIVLTNNTMNTWEGSASISDNCTGELLFYTNGVQVWNKNHVQMPNGIGLFGGNTSGLIPSSTTQSSIIVPQPGNKNIYYIFTNDAEEHNGAAGFRYSIVDMTLNAGLGDVTIKNTLLFAPGTEKVTGVHHSNKVDIWVISHGRLNNQFYAYLVTATGVSAPVISSVGANDIDQFGYLKISSDGKKLASCNYNQNTPSLGFTEIYDFDNTTGVVSNPISTPVNYYGCSFSPDCSKLYFGSANKFDQYDLNAGSGAAIIASKQNIDVQPNYGSAWAMQQATDGKIYATMGYNSLHVINNPNNLGSACNVVKRGVALNGVCNLGITNFVESFFNPTMFIPRGGLPTATIVAAGSCVEQPVMFSSVNTYTLDIDSVRWNFGDASSGALNTSTDINTSHIYSFATHYLVQLIRFADCGSDTTYYSLEILPKSIVTINDTTLCFSEPLNLQSDVTATSYLWQNGSTDPFLNVNEPGTYWLEITDECGVARDSAEVHFEDCEETLFVPNAFIPGTSVNNALFFAEGINMASFNMKIFNRWGSLLFESNDINIGWDGTYKGAVCQQDVYVWKITYESIASSKENTEGANKTQHRFGHVTLLR